MRLIGLCRLGNDPELRFTQNGDPVLNFTAAFSYGRKDDEGKRPTQWVQFSLWGSRAEKLEPYLKKGQLVYVIASEAHIETYEKRDGGSGSKLVARVDELEFTGKAESGGEQQERQPAPQPQPAPQHRQPPAQVDQFDDDIPF